MAWSPDDRLQQLAELKLKRRLQEIVTRANDVRAEAKEQRGYPRWARIMDAGVDALAAEADDKLVREVSQGVVGELIELLDSLTSEAASTSHEACDWVRGLFSRWRGMIEKLELSRHVDGLAHAETELDIKLLELQFREHLHRISMTPRTGATDMKPIDVFISHASEDKPTVARPLAEALRKSGYTVWLDETELTVGDNLYESIDRALASCRYGVVILSPDFFIKKWPKRELTALAARSHAEDRKTMLPIWHNVDHAVIARHSPMLAAVLGISSAKGFDNIVVELARVLSKP